MRRQVKLADVERTLVQFRDEGIPVGDAKYAETFIEDEVDGGGAELIMKFDSGRDAMNFYTALTLYLNMQTRASSRPSTYGASSGLPN